MLNNPEQRINEINAELKRRGLLKEASNQQPNSNSIQDRINAINQELERRKAMQRQEQEDSKGVIANYLNNWEQETRNKLNNDTPSSNANSSYEDASVWDKTKDLVTGELRKNEEDLPEALTSQMLSYMPWYKKEALGILNMITSDPVEMANIIKNFDDENRIDWTRDQKGNVVLFDKKTGEKSLMNAPGLSATDILQGLGEAALFGTKTKGGKSALKNIAGQTARDASLETGKQAIQEAAGGDFNSDDILLTAGISGLLRGGEEAYSKAKPLFTKNENVDNLNPNPTPEEKQAYDQFVKGIDTIESNTGMVAPTGMLEYTQPKTKPGQILEQFGHNFFGGTIDQQKAFQKERLERTQSLLDKYSEVDYDEVVQDIQKQHQYNKDAAVKIMNDATAGIGRKPIEHENTRATLVEQIKLALRNTNKTKKDSRVADNATASYLRGMLKNIKLDPSYENLKQMRTQLRDIKEGTFIPNQPVKEAALTKVYAAVSKDMENGIAKYAPNKVKSWKMANRQYGEIMKEAHERTIKRIYNTGELKPELVQSTLISKQPSDVKRLYNSLSEDGRSHGRAGLIQYAAEKAINKDGDFVLQKFMEELQGLNKQINIFFPNNKGKGENYRDALNGYIDLMKLTKSADIAVEKREFPFAMANWVVSGFAGATGLTGALGGVGTSALLLGSGFISRMFQSPQVRDLLARYKYAKKGSSKAEKIANEIESYVRPMMQTTLSIDHEEDRDRRPPQIPLK